MKLNRSLAISSKIQECKAGNILAAGSFHPPKAKIQKVRVFTEGNTLMTMVLTATQQDKSLKNSVGSLLYNSSTK